jgi:hypothetical protein
MASKFPKALNLSRLFLKSNMLYVTTLFSLISVGYELELRIAIIFCREYHFLPK